MEKALSDAIAAVEKKWGKGSIMQLDTSNPLTGDFLPSGSVGLDKALGGRGIPRGRIVELYGPESSGKTTLTLHAVAEAQRQGMVCAFVDMEHSLDPVYAAALGVDVGKLLISQPDYGEQAMDIVETLVHSGKVGLVVVDSVAALVPKAELEGEMGQSHVGLQARMMGQALRKLTGPASKTNTTLFFINQIRMKIGVMFGSPETTPGGRALKFYASVRLDVRRIGGVKDGEEVIGNRTRVRVVKSKIAPPMKSAEFDIIHGLGIDKQAELLDMAVEAKVVEKKGSWYSFKEHRLGQGRANAANALRDVGSTFYKDISTALFAPN
jgi:recombination protein RecA